MHIPVIYYLLLFALTAKSFKRKIVAKTKYILNIFYYKHSLIDKNSVLGEL